MSRLRPLILALMLISLWFGSALAGGRAGFRVEFPARLLLHAEQVVYTVNWDQEFPGPMDLLGLELLLGGEITVTTDERTGTAFHAVALYWEKSWLRAEIRALSQRLGVPRFAAALSGGIRW